MTMDTGKCESPSPLPWCRPTEYARPDVYAEQAGAALRSTPDLGFKPAKYADGGNDGGGLKEGLRDPASIRESVSLCRLHSLTRQTDGVEFHWRMKRRVTSRWLYLLQLRSHQVRLFYFVNFIDAIY